MNYFERCAGASWEWVNCTTTVQQIKHRDWWSLVVVGGVVQVAVTVFTCDDGGYRLFQADDQSACVLLLVVMKTLVVAHSRQLSSLLFLLRLPLVVVVNRWSLSCSRPPGGQAAGLVSDDNSCRFFFSGITRSRLRSFPLFGLQGHAGGRKIFRDDNLEIEKPTLVLFFFAKISFCLGYFYTYTARGANREDLKIRKTFSASSKRSSRKVLCKIGDTNLLIIIIMIWTHRQLCSWHENKNKKTKLN